MFQVYFYGFHEQTKIRQYEAILKPIDKMDMNDFMHSNSPYVLEYMVLPVHGPIISNSNSPPSPPMTFESPVDVSRPEQWQKESVGPHVLTNPGLDEINEFGTNVLQVEAWIVLPHVAAILDVATS